MSWVRKSFVHLLALLLLVSLLGLASAVSFNMNFSKPDHVETWLQQSNLYGHFVSNVISQSQQQTGGQGSSVSLTDTAVEQAAEKAFPPSLIQQDVNSFLESNYDWLNGKTATPNFSFNLSSEKQSFATQVGQYVKAYLTNLPVCSPAQLAQISNPNQDPLDLSCRPASLDPATTDAQVTQQLASSDDVLSNTTINAQTFNPTNGQTGAKPYYQQLSALPKAYRLTQKLPLILAGVSVLLILGIIFIAVTRRAGLRKVGWTFAIAGILLIVEKLLADYTVKSLEKHVFNGAKVGQLQQSLTNFFQHAESGFTKIDLYIGVAFLVVGLVILIAILATRNRVPQLAVVPDAAANPELQPAAPAPQPASTKSRPTSMDFAPSRPGASAGPTTAPTLPSSSQQPAPRPKRPRLIQ